MRIFKEYSREMIIYTLILAFAALGSALSGSVLSNYFKEVYHTDAFQRGFIEFPRELPGMLSIFFVAALSRLSDTKISMIAMVLAAAGIVVLGYATPTFYVMLIFIFINSVGTHLYMPMQSSIGMELITDGQYGKRMGEFSAVTTAFTMIGGLMVYFGFKSGFFSFATQNKMVFVWSAVFFFIAAILHLPVLQRLKDREIHHEKTKYVFRKEYKYYYTLVVMFGVQKQIMLVFGPWVFIDLLNKSVETLAILGIAGSFFGIFFMPALGKWLDKFGVKKLLYVDALSFIFVYAAYGLLSGGYMSGSIAKVGLPLMLGYVLFILDRMSSQMGMIRTIYLKKIAVDPKDITPTLSLGLTMDHLVSIVAAFFGGIVWMRFGPQYIFYLVAVMSLVNLYVAIKVEVE